MTALPVLVSGGIHTDGFIDTVDALSSYGDKEKKLEILKDPHTGAFAIIGAIMYYLLFFWIYDGDMGYKSCYSGECRLCFIAFAERIGNRHF